MSSPEVLIFLNFICVLNLKKEERLTENYIPPTQYTLH